MQEKTAVEQSQAESLWTIKELALFLKMSQRWVRARLCYRDDEPGSIPHIRLRRCARFIPAQIRGWVAEGCPPASDFNSWKQGPRRKRA
jgi:hypothetical protein